MSRENFFYVFTAHAEPVAVDRSAPWNQLRRWSRVFLAGALLLPVLTQAQTIFTVAGKSTGELGYSGDGGQATSATLNYPRNVGTDSKGNLYIADSENDRIRKVDTNGVITTVAGNGVRGFSGDGGLATDASFYFPTDVVVDSKGNIYICDSFNHVIRKVDASTKKISTVAGKNPTSGGADVGDGGPATSAYLYYPWGIALDASDNLYIAEQVQHHRIRKVTAATGIISTVAGNGTAGFSGDGGLATDASLGILWDIAVDKKTGDFYIADGEYYRVRKVTATDGKINTVAGTGVQAYNGGDGGAATSANVDPMSLDVDASGNLYITDWHNYIIRKVTPAGVIGTLAGTDRSNAYDYNIDGKAALNVSFYDPFGLAVDPSGKVLVADTNRVFKITTTDGKSDIVWRNTGTSSKGQNAFWFSANSNLAKTLSTRSDLNWKIAAVGDFNGDGSNDLLWRYISSTAALAKRPSSTDGTNEIWYSGESSTGMTKTLNSLSTEWVVAGVGNFDGDSYADIVWRNTATGDNQLWLDGTTSSALAKQPVDWQLAGIGDFNGDGVSDLVWRYGGSGGANEIWLSANSSTKQTMNSVVDQSWKIVGIGDVNGDRVSDLVWRYSGSGGANSIWLSANALTLQAISSVADQNWKVAGISNFDGDSVGKGDLLWRNIATGDNTIWLAASSATQQAVAKLDISWQAAGVGDF